MDIKTVTVIGAGTMGAGIAQVCAQAGYRTYIHDAQGAAMERAIDGIMAFWDKGIARGKTTPEQKSQWKDNLLWRGDMMDKVSESQLIIEAVPEKLSLKQSIFQEIDDYAPEGAILASNTSSLSIAEIAGATNRPEAVIGMHFFNPVPLMKLLELVRHEQTSQATIAASIEVAQRLGKQHILVQDMPGFATSRLGIALGNEAARMLEEGVASAADIDTAMRLGYGHPMGPLELSDLVGLDVRHHISQYLQETLGGAQWQAPAITQRLVEAGELGKKTGKGFYDWTSGQRQDRTDLGASP